MWSKLILAAQEKLPNFITITKKKKKISLARSLEAGKASDQGLVASFKNERQVPFDGAPLILPARSTSVMENSSRDNSTTDGGDTPPTSGLYYEGEKVLAYHGPRIYEAKVHITFLISRFLLNALPFFFIICLIILFI